MKKIVPVLIKDHLATIKSFILFFAAGFCVCQGTYSQTPDTIACAQNIMRPYRLNGKKLRMRELKPLLMSVPESKMFLKKYQSERLFSLLLSFAGLALMQAEMTRQSRDPRQRNNGYLIAGASVCLIAGYYFTLHEFKHLRRSVREYNRRTKPGF